MNTETDPPVEIETSPAPTHAVIWLHGLGADGNDFVPIVSELELPAAPVRFVFPHAPMQPVTINHGHVMRAWYDIVGVEFGRREDERGVRASQHRLEQLIARENERGIVTGRIVLAGFSQGGAIALQTGLRHRQRLAGIMALSTYVPLASSVAQERDPANADTPVYMAHGTQDEIIPLHVAQRSRQMLVELGYRVEWHEYVMPHSMCMEELDDVGAWLRRVLV